MRVNEKRVLSGLMLCFMSFVAIVPALFAEAVSDATTQDHLAQIVNVSGTVKVLKTGSADWADATKGMILEVGDKILTGPESFIEVAYDDHFMNLARIDQNTKAEFKSIEPTDLRLEDGSIFSALDGLEGQGYQVSTPVAVAAVRGTHFDVDYQASTKSLNLAVIPDTKPHESIVELKNDQGVAMLIQEGLETDLSQGQASEPKPVDPARLEEAKNKLGEMTKDLDPSLRKPDEGAKNLEGKDSDQNSEKKNDDDKKVGGPQPPRGPEGGKNDKGPSGSDGTVMSKIMDPSMKGLENKKSGMEEGNQSDLDEMADAMMGQAPLRTDASKASPDAENTATRGDDRKLERQSGNSADQESFKRPENPAAGVNPNPESSGKSPQTDFSRMMEFMNAGGAFNNKTSTSELKGVFNQMKFDEKTAGNLATNFGQMTNPEGDSPRAPVLGAPTGETVQLPPTGGTAGNLLGLTGVEQQMQDRANDPSQTFRPEEFRNLIDKMGADTSRDMISDIIKQQQQSTTAGTQLFPPPTTTLDPFQIFMQQGFLMELYRILDTHTDPGCSTGDCSYLYLGTNAALYNINFGSSPIKEDAGFNHDFDVAVEGVHHDADGGFAAVQYKILRDPPTMGDSPTVLATGVAICKDGEDCHKPPPPT